MTVKNKTGIGRVRGAMSLSRIPSNKVKHFKVLFEAIYEKLGNYEKAVEFIGVQSVEMANLNNLRPINSNTAKKILKASQRFEMQS